MNIIQFQLETVENGQIIRDGIEFENISFIKPIIDGKSIFETEDFIDSFVVYDELVETLGDRTKYLIFTCACGVADDGGWNGVAVVKSSQTIIWKVKKYFDTIEYIFDLNNYRSELYKLKNEIESLKPTNLEPMYVTFPEEW